MKNILMSPKDTTHGHVTMPTERKVEFRADSIENFKQASSI